MRGLPVPLPIKAGKSAGWGCASCTRTSASPNDDRARNLRVGRFHATRFGRVRWRDERLAAKASLADLQLDLDPDMLVRDVPAAERALIGFARAIQEIDHERGEVLILDEPTAFLPGPQ